MMSNYFSSEFPKKSINLDSEKSDEWSREMSVLEKNVVKFLSLRDFSECRVQFFATGGIIW